MPKLTFTMDLPDKRIASLITGILELDYEDDRGQIHYLATSGAPGRQHPDFFWQQGKLGPIPPGEYYIPSRGYRLDHPGIKGIFFHIQPNPISDLGRRSELGIHWDANHQRSPGTAGCIGLINKEGFDRFCDRLLELRQQGIKQLPLTVRYS